MPEQIEIAIDTEGKIALHVQGVKGKGCVELTKALEEGLGKVTERHTHREYHERPITAAAGQRLTQKG